MLYTQIPYGHKYEKEYVLRSITSYMAGDVFVPITVNNLT